MELRQIEYFLELCRLKNFTRAAEELLVTQPTITIAIKNLEREFGFPLFYRERGNLVLTEGGELFFPHASKIVEEVRRAYKEMETFGALPCDILSLGIPTVTGAGLYSIVMNQYLADNPNVKINLNDAGNLDIIELVENGELELGYVILSPDLYNKFNVLPLSQNAMSVIASTAHRFSGEESVDIHELQHEDIIMYEEGRSYTEKILMQQFQRNNMTLHVRYRIKHSITIFGMVAQNSGVSVILNDCPSAVNNHPGIIIRPFKEPILLETGLIWDKNKPLSKCAQAFIDFMTTIKHPSDEKMCGVDQD